MGKKKTVEIHTMRHIFLGDLLEDDPRDIWSAVSYSNISFGDNHDTIMHPKTLEDIMVAEGVPVKYQKKILSQIPEGVVISLGS